MEENIRILVLSTAALFAGITIFIIYFVVLYRNRQLKNRQEQEKLQSAFEQELLKARIEMQEQTLTYVSREIHDNITQVLSFVKLALASMAGISEKQRIEKINESRELVAQAINDLRHLSKSLSFEHISRIGLQKTIEVEVSRINRLGIINALLETEGEPYPLEEQRELVLFRIFQEALNNTLKHAKAKHFKIILHYGHDSFILKLEDDGKGFLAEPMSQGDGAGLRNMQTRAALIGADAAITSAPGEGCLIKICLKPLEQRVYADGNHPDSFG